MAAGEPFLDDLRSTLQASTSSLSIKQGDEETPAAYRERFNHALEELRRLYLRVWQEMAATRDQQQQPPTVVYNTEPKAEGPPVPPKHAYVPGSSDPFSKVPPFVQERTEGRPREEVVKGRKYSPDTTILHLGWVDGHRVKIIHTHTRETTFRWGCRIIESEQDARRHWRHNVSAKTRTHRPNADKLIDWVADICRYRGWQW